MIDLQILDYLTKPVTEIIMRLGAHVSTSGGLSKAVDRAHEIGAETIQIFASSPRAWRFKHPDETEISLFKHKSDKGGVKPCYIHASYLVNIGGALDQIDKSVDSLVKNMKVAGDIGAEGVIFHGGSHKGKGFDLVIDQAVECLKRVLDESPDNVWLCLENSAGMGAHIGSSFEEISRIIYGVDRPNMKVCLDTEHMFAAGYNIASEDDIAKVMEYFNRQIGLHKLAAVHANDSKVELSAGVDRHENIGEGFIGIEGFKSIMNHPAFRDVPFMLEVPGFDNKGPDKKNLDRLKDLRQELGIEF